MTHIKRDKAMERGYQLQAGTPVALARLADHRGDQHPHGQYIERPDTRGKTFARELVEELADATMYLMYEKQLMVADSCDDPRKYHALTAAHALIAEAATILDIAGELDIDD